MKSLPRKREEWCDRQEAPGWEESKEAPQIKSADCGQDAYWTKRCTSLPGVGPNGWHGDPPTTTRNSSR